MFFSAHPAWRPFSASKDLPASSLSRRVGCSLSFLEFRMKCPHCGSADFHLSRLRLIDAVHLLRILYPIRCRRCSERLFAGWPTALQVRRRDLQRRAEKRAAGKGR
jgi:hypothetical protein